MKRVALFLPLLLAGCDAALIPARRAADVYEFRLPITPPLVLRWPSGASVYVYVAAADESSARVPVLRDALRFGMAEWNQYATFGEYRLVETTDIERADVVLRWSDEPSPVDLAECPPSSTRAVTTFCAESDNLAEGLATFPRADGGSSRVKMVVSILPSESSVPGRVRALVTHELGHVLGIARHSDQPRDLMYSEELTTTRLSRRDIATIQLLYQLQPQVVP